MRSSRSPRPDRLLGCKEALFTLGDRPEDRWDAAKTWLEEAGYDSTLDYVRAMSIRVLEETGLLPHLNPGVMDWQEMARLKPVVAVDGDDAGDHVPGDLREPLRCPLRFPRQGSGGPAPGAGGRGPVVDPFHHRRSHRHRRNPGRPGRIAVRHPPHRPARTAASRKSSSRTSGPSRTPRWPGGRMPRWTSWSRPWRWQDSCWGRRFDCRRRRTSSTISSPGCCRPESTTGAGFPR